METSASLIINGLEGRHLSLSFMASASRQVNEETCLSTARGKAHKAQISLFDFTDIMFRAVLIPVFFKVGGIAQLVERQLCKLDVRGSNPLASTNTQFGSVAQLVRAPP